MFKKIILATIFGWSIGILFVSNKVFSASLLNDDTQIICHLFNNAKIEQFNKEKIHVYTLNNGMKVFMLANHSLPTIAMRMVIDVGAADEQPNQHGYAHLFEHMMFKGTPSVPDGVHFDYIKSLGGRLNATTDYDKTDYWSEIPSQYLESVLWLESERLQHLTLSEQSLNNQREAVLEEKLWRIDNVPYYKVATQFMISAWSGSNYDHLVIGDENSIQQADVSSIKQFFNHHYQPQNISLTLVGDLNPNEVIKLVKQYFEVIPSKHQPAEIDKQQNSFLLQSKTETRHDPLAPFPLYALGWHTVGKNNSDFYAVELMADILLNHDASRLKSVLKIEQALVYETIGFPLTFEQLGITAIGMIPHSYATFEQIKSLVKKELTLIHEQGVSSRELCSAQKHRQLKIIKRMAHNKGMAELISDGVLFFNDPYHYVKALNAYAEVDNDKIKEIAKRYFNENWLALEIVPNYNIRFLKWFMEILPRGLSEQLEQYYLWM